MGIKRDALLTVQASGTLGKGPRSRTTTRRSGRARARDEDEERRKTTTRGTRNRPANFHARQSPLSGGTMQIIYYITLE
jgi:hypothetical protein